MPTYLIERLDVNKKIIVNVRTKLESTSKFMKLNSLNSFSDIYYKKYIIITNDTDYEDIKTFINLNSKLKAIKIIKYSNELITLILNELITNRKNNICIEIEEKDKDLKTIYNSVNYLKKIKFSKILTVSSTSIDAITNCDEKIVMSWEWLEKYKKGDKNEK